MGLKHISGIKNNNVYLMLHALQMDTLQSIRIQEPRARPWAHALEARAGRWAGAQVDEHRALQKTSGVVLMGYSNVCDKRNTSLV